MPNIIVNNYCNQKCSYCFANANMQDKNLQKNMSLSTYLKILKYLKNNNDNNVRILGGEPLIFPNIRKFLQIANKGGFDIIIFSNINLNNENIVKTFSGLDGIRINCNINNIDFYDDNELKNIETNLRTLNEFGLKIIIGYNIDNLNKPIDFIFDLAKNNNISAINLKITNSSFDGNLLIDNSSRDLGIYIFETIKKYHNEFFIEISCGLDKGIFLADELEYIHNNTNINLKFGCEGNIGKFDINTDGSIFKCFPLESIFKQELYSFININNLLKNNINISKVIKVLNKGLISDGECTGNKKIKENI